MNESEHRIKPEIRTAAFFSMGPLQIARSLVEKADLTIQISGTDKKVKVIEAEPFSRDRVGARYSAMQEMSIGDVWFPPTRQILQTLIVAKDANGIGACVRLKEVEYYDPKLNDFVSELETEEGKFGQREGDIAKYFGKGKFERARLRFQDNSQTLFLVNEGEFTGK